MDDFIITPVIENSIKLLQYEINLLSGVKDQVSTLQYDLRIMNAFLKDSAGKGNSMSYLVKEVIDQTSEIGLEAEDIIDAYIAMAIVRRRISWLGKAYHDIIHKSKLLHRLANKTTRAKDLIRSINENKATYGITEVDSSFDAEAERWVRRKRRNVEEDDVVGFEDKANELVERIINPKSSHLDVLSIFGMGGLGKTTLARKIYKNTSLKNAFKYHAWVYVSQDYNVRNLFLDILKCILPKEMHEMYLEDPLKTSVEDLQAKIGEHLREKKYFVVMDDVWDAQVWEELKKAFPDDNSGSRILITCREKRVATGASSTSPVELKPLDKDPSWELLCKKVFRGETCPADMVDVGRKLAESCKGLPLSIVVLAGILANKEKSPQKWSDILAAKVISFLTEDGMQCSDILALSFKQLPHKLKTCFLYLGVFPEDFEISTRDLMQLWVAEGFIEQIGDRKVEAVAEDYLEELIDRSLIQVASTSSDGRVKTCRIHDLLRDFCLKQSGRENFYEVHSEDRLSNSISKRARRLSVHHHQLSECMVSTTSAYESTPSSSTSSSARSLLFFSQTKSSPIQDEDWRCICQRFKFIRVLLLFDVVLSSKWIPKQIEELIYLKHLRLKINRRHSYAEDENPIQIPNSICNLQFLETVDIRDCVLWPKNIWRMRQLRRLYARPMKFPDPLKQSEKAEELCNLQVLSSVLADQKTTGCITESKFPNLLQLGLFYDGDPKLSKMNIPTMTEILISLSKFRHLPKLKIFGFLRCEPPLKTLPSTLSHLSLEISTVDYNLIKIIKKLLSLNVLKINYPNSGTFRRLYLVPGDFPQLQVLRMESCYDLEMWIMESGAMPKLQRLFVESLSSDTGLNSLPDELWKLRELKYVELSSIPDKFENSIQNSSFLACHKHLESDKNSRSYLMTNGCHVLVENYLY